jgi:hypothetical protein
MATTAEPNLVENQKMKWYIIAMTRAGDVSLSVCYKMLCAGSREKTVTMKTLSIELLHAELILIIVYNAYE